MNQIKLAVDILESVRRWGVEDICICPGGRNAAFVKALTSNSPFQIHSGVDERATAFYALGKIKSKGRPVVVITTSGTAATELLPAIAEAHYTRMPLIVITADRPKYLRHLGAPQTLDQINLYGDHVEKVYDVEGKWEGNLSAWSLEKPLHINVCFEELDEACDKVEYKKDVIPYKLPIPALMQWRGRSWDFIGIREVKEAFSHWLKPSKQPLLVVSELKSNELEFVQNFINKWPGWVYIESHSGLRHLRTEKTLSSLNLGHYLKNGWFDSIVRIGGLPTHRFWRDLESMDVPVFTLANTPFPGLSKGSCFLFPYEHLHYLEGILDGKEVKDSSSITDYEKASLEVLESKTLLYPNSELSWFRHLSKIIPKESQLYIGNSLPLREWDLMAEASTQIHVQSNRGLNGIDGQLATALGYMSAQKEIWIVLGDLTTVYDLNAFWFWNQKKNYSLKLIVINNRGGGIFRRMYDESLFLNSHLLSFEPLAKFWGLPYAKSEPNQLAPEGASWLWEIVPDENQTEAHWGALSPK